MGYTVRDRLGPALLGVFAALVAASTAACTDTVDRAPSPAPSVSGPPAAALDATDARAAGVYAQVLRRYLSTPAENSFPERTFQRVFVLDRTVPVGGYALADPGTGAPIPAGTQRAILAALSDLAPASFVAGKDSVLVAHDGCGVVKDNGILVTLAPVSGDGDRVEVGVHGFVACDGATQLTYVVAYTTGGGWQVTGTTGGTSIT